MRRPAWTSLLAAGALAAPGCEVVTGFDDLVFEPEACVPDSADDVCRAAGAECGTLLDNCGNEVACDDVCAAPYACSVGGVDENSCGCTGGAHETPLAPPQCPIAETFEGRSYYFCDALSWDDAHAFCRSFGTDLVVVQTATENTYLQNRMTQKSWIGLRADPPCDPNLGCAFSWVDGVILDSDQFSNWNEGEPNNQGGGELCVEIQDATAAVGRWNDVTCANVLGVICETTCPDA